MGEAREHEGRGDEYTQSLAAGNHFPRGRKIEAVAAPERTLGVGFHVCGLEI